MFLAIGALKSPPDKIAVEFVVNRGISEKDLEEPGMSEQILRQQLLKVSGESDNHEGVSGRFKGWFTKMKTTHANYKNRKKFWDGKKGSKREYVNFRAFYEIPALITFIEDTAKITEKTELFSKFRKNSSWETAKKNLLEIKTAFDKQGKKLESSYDEAIEGYYKAEMAFIKDPTSKQADQLSKEMQLYEHIKTEIKKELKEIAQVMDAFKELKSI